MDWKWPREATPISPKGLKMLFIRSSRHLHSAHIWPLIYGNGTIVTIFWIARNIFSQHFAVHGYRWKWHKKAMHFCSSQSYASFLCKNLGKTSVFLSTIIITTTIFIVLSSTAPAICESSLWFLWAKVGHRQVAANSQAKLQTWPLSLPVSCYRPNIRSLSLVLLLNHKVDTHLPSPGGWKAESI